MLLWRTVIVKWRAVCAERCTCGSERRGREIVRLRSASYSTSIPNERLVYYLYLIMDIYGRDIVGYEVHESECGKLGKEVFDRAFVAAGMPEGLVLHSDNGAPMKSFTMRAKLDDLGVTPSFSRPRVSNDNPYSEALFRTVKYYPAWPSEGFKSLSEVREWVERFVTWYNKDHRHSKIKFVTPYQRRMKQDAEILAKRMAVLEKAKARNPSRWTGSTRNCDPVGPVKLNPDKLIAVS